MNQLQARVQIQEKGENKNRKLPEMAPRKLAIALRAKIP